MRSESRKTYEGKREISKIYNGKPSEKLTEDVLMEIASSPAIMEIMGREGEEKKLLEILEFIEIIILSGKSDREFTVLDLMEYHSMHMDKVMNSVQWQQYLDFLASQGF